MMNKKQLNAANKMKLQIPISTILKKTSSKVLFSGNQYDSIEIDEKDGNNIIIRK